MESLDEVQFSVTAQEDHITSGKWASSRVRNMNMDNRFLSSANWQARFITK